MPHFLSKTLPHDLPENWTTEQYVSPDGTSVGLTEKHGYNYLNRQVNDAQNAIMTLAAVACAGSENMVDNAYFEDPISTSGGYCVLKGTKYYRESTLTTQVNTTTQPLTAQYVDSSYGTITVGTTQYYVSFADMYEGYTTAARAFTFDRWYGLGCSVVRDKSGKGFTITASSAYAPGQFFQAIASSNRLSNKQVTLSVLVESVTGSVDADLLSSDYANANITTKVATMKLTTGMNTRVVTLSANIGKSSEPYLHLSISVPVGASVTIRAVKLQFGEKQTLAYDDGNSWEYVQLPNRVIEYLRCVGAPVEYGGKGTTALSSDIINATVEE